MNTDNTLKNDTSEMLQRFQRFWAELEKSGLDGFIIPRADEFQGEYIPPSAQRLAWLTGFTGSAGLAIVHRHGSAIFVDGRYILAVREQVDESLFKVHDRKDCLPEKWLKQQPKAKLGYDPWLHTPSQVAPLQQVCEKVGGQLIPCETNPVDAIWADQPEPPVVPIIPHPIAYTGESSESKRERIAEILVEERVDAFVLTAPDSIAWLLNIRGGDVPHAPLPHCFAILYAEGKVDLFVNPRKIGEGLLEHLGEGVTIAAPAMFNGALEQLGEMKQSVQVDPKQTALSIINCLKRAGARLIKKYDPCALPKACKNEVEIAGARAAHLRDGLAMTRFLHWLSQHALAGRLEEREAAERLRQFRAETGMLYDLSFETISAVGANAAKVHYQLTEDSHHIFQEGSLYLFDSGGQYLDGTTDVTRTVAIGGPTDEHRDRFTRVLKGHIAIASCRFPERTTGTQLDVLARHALWQVGLDYQHGTGHGVGSFLSVHEGPQHISKRKNNVALKPGMILSNEPGYYKEGDFGIRIENLILVTPLVGIEGGELDMMGFEPLTLVPIDLNLVEPSLLNASEKTWLNNYHKRVFEEIGPALDEAARNWLVQATRTIQ
jgi:Xaa-Pro aminopeptidase